jgi:hypothetical protein
MKVEIIFHTFFLREKVLIILLKIITAHTHTWKPQNHTQVCTSARSVWSRHLLFDWVNLKPWDNPQNYRALSRQGFILSTGFCWRFSLCVDRPWSIEPYVRTGVVFYLFLSGVLAGKIPSRWAQERGQLPSISPVRVACVSFWPVVGPGEGESSMGVVNDHVNGEGKYPVNAAPRVGTERESPTKTNADD